VITLMATLLTAIDLRCSSDIPGIDLALTCAATGHRSGQLLNHADASDSACYGGDREAPGRSPAESHFRAGQDATTDEITSELQEALKS
jgi:hypothetical protein